MVMTVTLHCMELDATKNSTPTPVNNIDVFTSAHTASSPANLAHALALVLYSGTTNCVLHTNFSLPLALAYTLALALLSLAHALHT